VKIVAQIANLPCRRMAFGRASIFRETGGLPIRDTAAISLRYSDSAEMHRKQNFRPFRD